jgi:hypothetical protein
VPLSPVINTVEDGLRAMRTINDLIAVIAGEEPRICSSASLGPIGSLAATAAGASARFTSAAIASIS